MTQPLNLPCRIVGILAALTLPGAVVRGDELQVPRDGFEFSAEITGRGEPMNYGPFLSYSVFLAGRVPGAGPKEPDKVNLGLRTGKAPLILKGITLRLDDKHACVFDADMCAMAAAWSGGFLDIGRTNLNGTKGGDLAYLRLPAIFQNDQLPGWSKDGEFKDSRPVSFGPLPKEVAHYRGLYLHEGRTILSYSAGKSQVLEMPSILVRDKTEVFCRTIRIDASEEERHLLLIDLPDAEAQPGRDQHALKRKDVTIRVMVQGLPEEPRFTAVRGRLSVKMPPHRQPLTFRVFVARDIEPAAFADVIDKAGPTEDISAYCKGGPRRWKEDIVVKGRPGRNDTAYTIDDIPLPEDNPWKAWVRPGAFDFLPDGRAVVGTWNGDVWIASGLDDKLTRIVWRRFATGLFEVLGLKVSDGKIYALGRDQITRLHDLNDDGEADYYENFNNDAPAAPSFHTFALDLHTDGQGNFYYHRGAHRVPEGTPLHGCILKVSKDGSKVEALGSGLREANGLSVGPDGLITVADNQGNWVPSSKIDVLKPGGYYGYPWGVKSPPAPEPPLCWIPMKEDNSSGSQVWVDSDKWGPLKGHLLHTSYGTGKLFKVFVQRDGDRFQGGVTPFPLEFETGIMRARFHPGDGQLYVCGLKGWGTTATADGGFYRVRYTGKPVAMPAELKVSKDEIRVTFTTALDRKTVSSEAVDVRRWNYRYSKDYGSKDYSVINPTIVGRDLVDVRRVFLADDGKTVVIQIPGLKPVHQMMITFEGLKAADGSAVESVLYHTINYVPD